MAKAFRKGYFALLLPINPRKLQNFSTSNNLQYTVQMHYKTWYKMLLYIVCDTNTERIIYSNTCMCVSGVESDTSSLISSGTEWLFEQWAWVEPYSIFALTSGTQRGAVRPDWYYWLDYSTTCHYNSKAKDPVLWCRKVSFSIPQTIPENVTFSFLCYLCFMLILFCPPTMAEEQQRRLGDYRGIARLQLMVGHTF